jgi:epoxyqueuosine reductase
LRAPVGDLVYGCDICQEVCPWNEKFSLPLREAAFRPRAAIAGKDARTLAHELLAMSDEGFSTAFKHSPMKRAKLRGLRRNAAVVLGNIANSDDESVLVAALDHPEPLVGEHAAWALDRVRSRR